MKRSWDGEEEKKAKVKQRKWGSGVLPGSLVNTLQTLFAAEHFLQSTQPSLHDSRVRRIVRACVHLLVKYSYIGCVPGELFEPASASCNRMFLFVSAVQFSREEIHYMPRLRQAKPFFPNTFVVHFYSPEICPKATGMSRISHCCVHVLL